MSSNTLYIFALINVCTVLLLGYLAWLRESGSWFIQTLCRELNNKDVINGVAPLIKTLTRVSAGVAIEYESSGFKTKEMPVVYSMLIKDVYFTQKN